MIPFFAEGSSPYDIITKCIEEQLWPFRPGLTIIEVIRDPPALSYIIRVSCDLFDEPIFLDGRALYTIPYEDIPLWIGIQAGTGFAERTEPVPDNIILSEN